MPRGTPRDHKSSRPKGSSMCRHRPIVARSGRYTTQSRQHRRGGLHAGGKWSYSDQKAPVSVFRRYRGAFWSCDRGAGRRPRNHPVDATRTPARTAARHRRIARPAAPHRRPTRTALPVNRPPTRTTAHPHPQGIASTRDSARAKRAVSVAVRSGCMPFSSPACAKRPVMVVRGDRIPCACRAAVTASDQRSVSV